jgi:serine/threonine-protein kinase HipA
MFELTREFMAPTDILRLLDIVIFNILACNTDAHVKNYAMMIRASGASIAPMYDVMCGEVWDKVTKNFAQHVGGERRGDRIRGMHWRRFARECGLNPSRVLARVGALAKSAIAEAGAAAADVAALPAGHHAILDTARLAVENRASTILAQLQEAGEAPAGEAVEDIEVAQDLRAG